MQQAAPLSNVVPIATPPIPASCPVTYLCQTEQQPPPARGSDPWAVGGPALIALAGVLLTLTVKWVEDRRAARRDLRRELFLKVIESISESGLLLGSFGKTAISLDALSDWFARCLGPLSMAEVVAETPLLTAMTSLKNQLGLAFGELVRARLPMERSLADIAGNKSLIEDASLEIKTVLAEQARLALDGVRTEDEKARYARLQHRFEYFQKVRQGYYDENIASSKVIQEVVAHVANKGVEVQRDLIVARVQVLALIREELGFKFNMSSYVAEHVVMGEVASADFAKTVDAVSKTFRTSD